MSGSRPPLPARESARPVSPLAVQMVIVGVLGLLLSLVRLAPPLGIPIFLIAVLGWLRNRTITRRRREVGLPTASWDRFTSFLISCFEMIFVSCGTLVIFILMLLVAVPLLSPIGSDAIILIGLILSVLVSVLFIRWILKDHRRQFNPANRPFLGPDVYRSTFPRSTTSFTNFDPATIGADSRSDRFEKVISYHDHETKGEAVDEDDEVPDHATPPIQPRRDPADPVPE